MKKSFKKIIAIALVTAFSTSLSFPVLASEPTPLTTSQKLSILEEYNDAYDVNLQYGNNPNTQNITSRNTSANDVMCEEEFRLHAELLAVIGNLSKPLSDSDREKFESKYYSILKELDEKYPLTTSVSPEKRNVSTSINENLENTSEVTATQYNKTKTKNAVYISITSTLTYVTNPVERFVRASNIRWNRLSGYSDIYTTISADPLIDPYYEITLDGEVITITVDGLTGQSVSNPNLWLSIYPQFVTYQISEM